MDIDAKIAMLVEQKKKRALAQSEIAKAFLTYCLVLKERGSALIVKDLRIGVVRNYCTITNQAYAPDFLKSLTISDICEDLEKFISTKEREVNTND